MRLETSRLILRPVTLSDLERYFELDSNHAVAVPLGLPGPASITRTRKSIIAAMKDWRKKKRSKMAFTILSRRGRAWLGGLNLRWPHSGVAELGFMISPIQQGKGYATEAVLAAVELAFRKMGAHRVQATCWIKNKTSARVLEKAGLRKEGTLRGYLKRGREVRDEFMFGVTRTDWKKGLGPRTAAQAQRLRH